MAAEPVVKSQIAASKENQELLEKAKALLFDLTKMVDARVSME
jgi:hypothetical protein